MPVRVTTAPTIEPVSLAEARAHLRVEHGLEDALIESLIAAARGHAEAFTGRRLLTQTVTWTLDRFDACALARVACALPLQSVTSIAYIDTAGATQTLATSVYQVDVGGDDLPGRIGLKDGQSWPDTLDTMNAVTVTLTAGYTEAAKVPAAIRAAILLIVGHLYRNRESVITGTTAVALPMGAEALLYPHKVWSFG